MIQFFQTKCICNKSESCCYLTNSLYSSSRSKCRPSIPSRTLNFKALFLLIVMQVLFSVALTMMMAMNICNKTQQIMCLCLILIIYSRCIDFYILDEINSTSFKYADKYFMYYHETF